MDPDLSDRSASAEEDPERAVSPPELAASGRRLGPLARRWEWVALLAMVVGDAVVMTYLCNLRVENFYSANWDLGINQQLLWTTAHGRLLYETADLAFFNAHSYLQVHSTYVAFAIAPIYAAWPHQITLLSLECTVFAVSAIPLYLYARETVQRPGLRLAAITLYLAGFGAVSALTFDFHWESFLPLEFLTFFLLVRRERFLWSLVPFAAGTMTLEVFPFLAGGVLLFFLVERAESDRWELGPFLRDPRVRLLAGFLALALAAYLTVRLFQYTVIPGILNVPSTTGGGPSGIQSTVGWGANRVTLPASSAYWFLLLASLAFLPLLAPRHLILSIPWFVYSVLVAPWFSAYFGEAYSLIALAPLALAAVSGLGMLERQSDADRISAILLAALAGALLGLLSYAAVSPGSARILGNSAGIGYGVLALLLFGLAVAFWKRCTRQPLATPVAPPDDRTRPAPRRNRVLLLLTVVLVTVLVLDAVMSPMNPTNFDATPIPGYLFHWGENPMTSQVGWVVAHVPGNAQVLASNHLFPYVANDPNAWALPWFVINATTNPVPYLPFSPQNLPRFVLVDASEMQWVPSFLASDLFNRSIYGLVAYAYMEAYPGTVYLFELGHSGPPAERVVGAPPSPLIYGWSNLTPGPCGTVVPWASSSFGRAIVSEPVGPLNATVANVWAGPYVPLLPGTYSITFSVSGAPSPGTNGTTPLAILEVTWTGGTTVNTLLRTSVDGQNLAGSGWSPLSYTLTLSEPYPLVQFRGFLFLHDGRSVGSIALNYVEAQRTGP